MKSQTTDLDRNGPLTNRRAEGVPEPPRRMGSESVKSMGERLLDRVALLKSPCDLDVVLLCSGPADVLITTEDLTRFVGSDLQRLARSLDSFIAGRIARSSQNNGHAARMYVLDSAGPAGGRLPS